MFHQKIGAMLFRRDRVRIRFRDALHDLHVSDIEFVSAGGALVGADFPFDDDTRFLRQRFHGFEDFRTNGIFGNDALNDPRSVAKLREQ